MKVFFRSVFTVLSLMLVVGCGGGGGSSCPSDTPLVCSNGTCCPRGFPYSCGNGYCYQYGCPAGSPDLNVCEFKMARTDTQQGKLSVPEISAEQAKMCVPEAYPVEDTPEQDAVK